MNQSLSNPPSSEQVFSASFSPVSPLRFLFASRSSFNTYQVNVTVERAIRAIFAIGRSILYHAKLDKCVLAEVAMTSVYVNNRLPSPNI